MLITQVINCIEQIAPLCIAASWDNSGWQVASHKQQITTLALCLDPTPASIKQALAHKADLIISHHPLTINPCFVNKLDSYHEVLSQLLSAQVGLYSAHTSLDANPLGPVTWLAHELNLSNLNVLEPTATFQAQDQLITGGFGIVGDCQLTQSQLRQALIPYVQQARIIGKISEYISRLAICPGSGADLASLALAQNAELYITGDVKYHAALEFQLPVLDLGHFVLEEEMMQRFARLLQQNLDLNVVFVSAKDPFSFF